MGLYQQAGRKAKSPPIKSVDFYATIGYNLTMQEQHLCGECASQNRCWFVSTVDKRLDALPPSRKQVQIVPDAKITQEALTVNNQIAEDRITARSFACPQVNYNPQNPRFQPNL